MKRGADDCWGDEGKPEAKRPTLSDQASIAKRILDGETLFFTGAAGTGKTYLLKDVIKQLYDKHGDEHVFVTAPTGIASCHIEGVTIHSFAGLPPMDNPTIEYIARSTLVKKTIVERWKDAKVLVIDECSMVDPIVFDGLDLAARRARDVPNVPFGGVQIVLCGDFLQLKPVIKDPSPTRPVYLFQSKAWDEMIGTTHVYELREVYRQKDPDFLTALSDLRVGKLDARSRVFFKRLSDSTVIPSDTEAVHIYTTRNRAGIVNSERLALLEGPTMSYAAIDKSDTKFVPPKERGESSNWMAPDLLELRKGAQVMLLKNLVPGVLANGTTGIVVGFTDSPTSAPIVTFTTTTGEKHTMTMNKATWERKMGHRVIAKRTQYPLILSWAITAHKSQGMTIDRVVACLSGSFEPGQAYVSVSRARTPEGLKIEGNLGRMIPPDERVLGFYERCGLSLK